MRSCGWAHSAGPSARACRLPACGRAVGGPPSPPRDRGGRASSCSCERPRAAAGCRAVGSRSGGAPLPGCAGVAQGRVARLELAADRLRIDLEQPAGPPLGKPALRHQAKHGRATGCGPDQFFPSRSFKAATSSIDSPSSFFSRFSSSKSSAFGRRTPTCRCTSPSSGRTSAR